MKSELKGQVLLRIETKAHSVKIAEFTRAIGTDSALETARLAAFFGPTIAGEEEFVRALGLNLDRALMGSHELKWLRPFVPDESLRVELRLADIYEKNKMQFGVVETTFRTPTGEEIQTQRTTFIERLA